MEPIAVVGMACRFPGGISSPEDYWRVLIGGHCTIGDVPADRFDVDALFDADPATPGRMYMQRGAFLDRVDGFDAAFFRISPREATQMDPQQRLFMEVCWEALENAQQPPLKLANSDTGVVAGVLSVDYANLPGSLAERVDAHYYTGLQSSFIAGRVSHFLGLQGKSLTVDTACSSSLVAVHLGCESLRSGETSLMIVGGVNLILSPEVSMYLCKAQAMSPTGVCRAFDRKADGMVRGEGCGVLVLKRLSDAQAGGDRIHAVLRATAVNHDGPSAGLTVPNARSQSSLYRAALRTAGVAPAEISYVEAHGTGTNLGDPAELDGLAECYGEDRQEPLLIGSVKTNIGHTDSASGIAGLIKTILLLEHRRVPPSLFFEEPNPRFDWDRYPIRVAAEAVDLEDRPGPLRAGVSSFGLSGMNAHAVVEEYPETLRGEAGTDESGDRELLLLSAQSPAALRGLARSVGARLASAGEGSPREVCSALASGRSHLDYRLAVGGNSSAELVAGLRQFEDGGEGQVQRVGDALGDEEPILAWVFSGQGPEWWGMGRQLFDEEPVFRSTLEQIEEIFSAQAGWSLLGELFVDESVSRIHDTVLAQPALFAVQVGIAAVWESLGVTPDAVVGHSMGEVAAAHVAGVLDLETAVRVIRQRGEALERVSGLGNTMAVGLSPQEAERLLEPYSGKAWLSARNSPTSVSISGSPAAVEAIARELARQQVFHRVLPLKYASHCPLVDSEVERLKDDLEGIRAAKPGPALISTASGELAQPTDFDAGYWAAHLRAPVLFAPAIRLLLDLGCSAFLEVGPHPAMAYSIRECLEEAQRSAVVLGSLSRKQSDRASMLDAWAQLYRAGFPVEPSRLYPERAAFVDLPNYPWQRRRYWLSTATGLEGAGSAGDDSPGSILGRHRRSPLAAAEFSATVSAKNPGWLSGHRVSGNVIFPGAGFLSMALAAGAVASGQRRALIDARFMTPLALVAGDISLRTVVDHPGDDGVLAVRIFARSDDSRSAEWTLHATASLGEAAEVLDDSPSARLEEMVTASEGLTGDEFYASRELDGYDYQGGFRCLETVWVADDAVAGRLRLPDEERHLASDDSLDVALLDASMHAVLPLLEKAGGAGLFVPEAVGRFEVWQGAIRSGWTEVRLREVSSDGDSVLADISILDDDKRTVAQLSGLRLRRIAPLAREEDRWTFAVEWQKREIDAYVADISAGERWLVLADDGGLTASLADRFRSRGIDTTIVSRKDVDALSRQAVADLIAPNGELAYARVLHGWALDTPDLESADELLGEVSLLCGSVLHLVQAMVGSGVSPLPRLWILTRGCQMPVQEASGSEPVGAALWGLARVLALEHPALGGVCIDLDSTGSTDHLGMVARELEAGDGEDQVALRQGHRFVARLLRRRLKEARPTSGEGPVAAVELKLSEYGILENLELRRLERSAPRPGEVEIGVVAAGLNFRDVLSALGMLNEFLEAQGVASAGDLRMGFECAGRVTAIGEGVEGLAIGDEVVAGPVSGCFASHVIAPWEVVVPKPPGMSFEEAAAIPVVFLTARFALLRLAQLGEGDSVLIHSAAGGVGQAAVQIAQSVGARVFATASPGKWDMLRAQGVEHLMNSRSLDFADEVLELTEGTGVDVVLNSLGGEFIDRSLEVCADGGRFIEIGKIGVLDEEEARRRYPQLLYRVFDLEEAAIQTPGEVNAELRNLMMDFAAGKLSPLRLELFPLTRARDAFRFMAQAKHVGKVVIRAEEASPPAQWSGFREDRSYLITGGLGGLGLRLAGWLTDQGARHLVLAGRSAASDEAAETIAALRKRGVHVSTPRLDAADAESVAEVLESIDLEMPPLGGVFHLAAVLDDGVLVKLDLRRFQSALGPKLVGAWNLSRATTEAQLDYFVLFSSAIGLLGAPGQGNYAAANAFLDALALWRRERGLPGLSVSWGPWSEAGRAAALSARDQERWAARGVRQIPVAAGFELLGEFLQDDPGHVVVLPVDWKDYVGQLPGGGQAPFLDNLVAHETASRSAAADFRADLDAAAAEDRRRLLVAHIQSEVARVLGLPSSEAIHERGRLFDLGLDSLMALELGNRLAAGLGRTLRSTLLFDYPTVAALADHIGGEVLGWDRAEAQDVGTDARVQQPSQVASDGGDLDELSDDELARLLAEEVGGVPGGEPDE